MMKFMVLDIIVSIKKLLKTHRLIRQPSSSWMKRYRKYQVMIWKINKL